jgi:hypothetical protein
MQLPSKLGLAASLLLGVSALRGAPAVEKIHNAKVWVFAQTLGPGEVLALPPENPGVIVCLDDGSLETSRAESSPHREAVTRGEAIFEPGGAAALKNGGAADLRLVWTEYLGPGSAQTWGLQGLAPHYSLLLENRFGRVYDIRIAAQGREPLHSHHQRVVICLSGAELEHILPDGRIEKSSLDTGDIAWRPAATHIGHNLGQTDLWVIAIEPK